VKINKLGVEIIMNKKTIIIICAITAGLILCTAAGFGIYMFTPNYGRLAAQVTEQIGGKDYEAALETVKKIEKLGLKQDVNAKITELLSAAVAKNTEYCIDNSLYDEGLNDIEAFKSVFGEYNISFTGSQTELLNIVKQSEQDFNDGQTFHYNFHYTEAVEKYSLVSEQDTKRYETAQLRIQDCNDLTFEYYKEEAASAYSDENYQSAVDNINKALEIKSDGEAEALKAQYEKTLSEQLVIYTYLLECFNKTVETLSNEIGKPYYADFSITGFRVKYGNSDVGFDYDEGTYEKYSAFRAQQSNMISAGDYLIYKNAVPVCISATTKKLFNTDSYTTLKQLNKYFKQNESPSPRGMDGTYVYYEHSGFLFSFRSRDNANDVFEVVYIWRK